MTSCWKPWHILWFLRQKLLLSLYLHRLISPPLLCCLHVDEVLVFSYQSQPVSVQRNLNRRKMVRHFYDRGLPESNKYDTEKHGEQTTHIPHAASIHDQRRKKTEELPLLRSEASSKVTSFHASNCLRTYKIPEILTEIIPLSPYQRWKFRGDFLPGLQSDCDPSGRGLSDRWKNSVPWLPVGECSPTKSVRGKRCAE